MANVELSFYPSTLHCLAWSPDGELAIAAGEFVHILVPNRPKVGNAAKCSNPRTPVGPWHHVHFRVNTFNEEEWPYQEPASLNELSLGAEQSTSIVTALAWSGSGLGIHGRCILAVLTSNLVVSLWEPRSHPADSWSWYRSCVLNHALQKHAFIIGAGQPSRRQSRIRAVTWSCQPDKYDQDRGWKRSDLLALANDDGDLYFLRLDRTRRPRTCRAEVLLHLSAKTFPKPTNSRDGDASEEPQVSHGKHLLVGTKRRTLGTEGSRTHYARDHVSHILSWSDWYPTCNVFKSVLVYKRAGLEIHQQLSCSPPDITGHGNGFDYGKLQLFPEGEASVQSTAAYGPSIWQDTDWGKFQQYTGGGRQIVDLSYYMIRYEEDLIRSPTHDNSINHMELMDKPDCWTTDTRVKNCPPAGYPWEHISGMCNAITPDQNAMIVCIATHLSLFRRFRIDFVETPGGYQKRLFRDNGISHLKRRMDDCRRRFAKARKLGTKTVMKTWGLASHGSLFASIITLHPSEMVEYTTLAQERSTVLFSTTSHEDIPIKEGTRPDEHVTDADMIVRFPWEEEPEIKSYMDGLCYHLCDMEFEPFDWSESLDTISSIASFNLICARYLFAHQADYSMAIHKETLMENGYAQVIAKAASYESPPTFEEKLDFVNSLIRITESHEKAQRALPVERCICGERLEWEDLRYALCPTGHRWRRCAISLIAIQEPGISKFCESCEAQFLNEQHFPLGTGDEETGDEIGTGNQLHVPCDVRDLFRSAPVCIFCKGKFVS